MQNVIPIKLHQPAPPSKRVQRLALVRRLNDGLAEGRPLTLVSAPAGFGKTACVSEWLAEVTLPVTWLSLDAADNDPQRFLSYLVAALNKIGSTPGLVGILRAGQLPPPEAIAAALIQDILAFPGVFILVLDDVHAIHDRSILQVLGSLLTGLLQSGAAGSEQPLRLMILTREEPSLPLARLRASGLLTEIRAAELRFTGDEAARFLNEVMTLRLSPSDIAALEERTEGWIAGLQLAGLSIRDRADPSGFIRGLTGSHRHILSYLTEEVLNRQPEEIKQFLLSTSILDRLTGGLCDAVTGRADSADLLERLCGANMFIVPLDDEQCWYRYHHLFGGLLQNRQKAIQGEQAAALHRLASRWYAQACENSTFGERSTFAGEAIRHALAAEDYATAVRLIEDHALEMLRQWHMKTVSDWMQALPPEWSEQSPRANLAFARMHLTFAEFAQAAPYIARLQKIFSIDQSVSAITPAVRAEWLALQSTLLGVQGSAAESLALAQQALALAPVVDDSARSQIYTGLALAYQRTGDIPRAIDAFQKTIELGRSGADLVTELMGIAPLALLLMQRGQLRSSYELCIQGVEHAARAGAVLPILASIYGELGQICYQWGQWEQSRTYSLRAAEMSARSGFSDAVIFHTVTCASLALLHGEVSAAAAEIKKAVEQMRADAPLVVRESVIAVQVRILLAQNDLPAAETALCGLSGVLPDLEAGQEIHFNQAPLYIAALRVHLQQVRLQQGPERARALADGFRLAGRLVEAAVQARLPLMALETLLVRAQLHHAAGDPRSSLADVSAALDLAEPEGCISDFVAEGPFAERALVELLARCPPGSLRAATIQKILAVYSAARGNTPVEPAAQHQPQNLIESLTERELDVLRCVAEGLKYEQIAGRLVISLNTVRSHVKAIYGKLGVNNRTSAIDAARRHKLMN